MQATNWPRAFQCYTPREHHVYGTILISPEGRILIVKGRKTGIWSFPKGHLEANEQSYHCALRELLEETGIDLLLHQRHELAFCKLYKAHYYIYLVEEEMMMTIQDNREIEEVRWISLDELRCLPQRNVDINDFMERIGKKWRGRPALPLPRNLFQPQYTPPYLNTIL
jgi:8-oxo-dGTP pyrophosphatase MutT (NUDIX family)